jgi:LPXTG-motif cell wall-anchored protein
MALNAPQAVRELISYTIVTDKQSLVKLLERNGVSLPSDPSDKEVTIATLMASAKSPNFKKELAKLLTKKVPEAGEAFSNLVGSSADFGFTGVDDLGFTGVDDYANVSGGMIQPIGGLAPKKDLSVGTLNIKPQPLTAQQLTSGVQTQKGRTAVGGILASIGKFFKDNVLTQENINTGLQLGLTTINNKVQSKQNAVQGEALILQQQQDQMRNDLGKRAGVSTNTIIIAVVGVAIIGAAIYVLTKKK